MAFFLTKLLINLPITTAFLGGLVYNSLLIFFKIIRYGQVNSAIGQKSGLSFDRKN